MSELNARHLRFVEEYLVDRNGTQSAIRAGFSKKTANQQASRLLTNVNIKRLIAQKEQKLLEKTQISQTWVLNNYKELAEFNKEKIDVPVGSGENAIIQKMMRDANVAQRATDSVAKHLGMFTEKVEVTGKDGKDLIPPDKQKENLVRGLAFLIATTKKDKEPKK
jgi:phage terminase small subunit